MTPVDGNIFSFVDGTYCDTSKSNVLHRTLQNENGYYEELHYQDIKVKQTYFLIAYNEDYFDTIEIQKSKRNSFYILNKDTVDLWIEKNCPNRKNEIKQLISEDLSGTTTLTLRLSKSFKDKLISLSEKDKISINRFVISILKKEIDK